MAVAKKEYNPKEVENESVKDVIKELSANPQEGLSETAWTLLR